jgi:hypothetical protein
MKLLVISLLFSLNCFHLFAAEVNLIKITNNMDNEHSIFSVTTDQNGDILSFTQTGYLKERQIYKLSYLISDAYNGVTIYKRKGRDIVDLITDNLTEYNGGNITLNYVFNAVTGSRKQVKIELSRDGDEWKILHENKVVQDMHCLVHRKPIVGAVGIRSIEFNYLEDM